MVNENWLKTDKVCESCGQVTEKQKGFTKQNLKRLCTIKFDMTEVIWMTILVLVLVLAFAYKTETAVCREWIGPMFEGDRDNCIETCSFKCSALIINETKPTTWGGMNLTMTNLTMP